MTSIIAVTACPSGVAHLHGSGVAGSAARAKGWQVKVETQGSIGIENELSADDVPRRYRDSDQRYRHQV
jgi:fructose-specific PTS system IIB-like component